MAKLKPLHLPRTAAALDQYDQDPSDENAAQVGEAYAAETADRNHPSVKHLVPPGRDITGPDRPFVRRMVDIWRARISENSV